VFNPNSKVLVAGGTGMVGSAIIRALKKRGFEDISATFFNHHPVIQYPDVHYYKIDLTNQLQTAHFFAHERPEYVFMAAARVGGIEANNTLRAQFIYENLQMQNNVIHYSYLTGVKKLLFLGSSCIYPKESPQPIKEEYLLTGPLEYTNEPYAIAKIAGLKLCESYNLQYGTNFISAMPTNLYGINDNFNLKTSHVLPALLRKFHLGKLLQEGNIEALTRDLQVYELGHEMQGSIFETLKALGISRDSVELWGSGKPRRDLLNVDDAADALLYLMEKVDFKDLRGNGTEIRNTHINIGSGTDLSIREIAELIRDIVGFNGEIVYNTSKPDGMLLKRLDNTKINNLGWYPKIDLKEGIKEVYEWYLKTLAG
jgi:GDP-L-fucose synthase